MTITTQQSQSTTTSSSSSPSPSNRLLNIHQLPAWMRDNDYLIGSYRPPTESLRACLKTAFFTLNNDTINVWTHFIGALTFLFISIHLLGPATSTSRRLAYISSLCQTTSSSQTSSTSSTTNSTIDLSPTTLLISVRAKGLRHLCAAADTAAAAKSAVSLLLAEHRLGMLPLLAAAVICLAFSTAFHACWVLSPRALSLLGRLDFIGISLLCCGHAASGVYHMFYCRPTIAQLYYIIIATVEALALPAILAPWFSTPAARFLRTAIFCALGSVSFLPLVHATLLHSQMTWEFTVGLGSSVFALSVYAVGATIYVSRFPECCRVGRHDRFFSSHQLMHIAVLVGVAVHLAGCWILLEWRLSYGCSDSPLIVRGSS